MGLKKTSYQSLWFKELGQAATTYTLQDIANTGMGELAVSQISDVSPLYGRNELHEWYPIMTITAQPGDFNNFQIMFRELDDELHQLITQINLQKGFKWQRRVYSCPPISTSLWKQLEYFKLALSGASRGAGPMLDGSEGPVESNVTVKVLEHAHIIKGSLASLTMPASIEEALCVTGVPYDIDCLGGWPGADKIILIGCDDDASTDGGKLLYSRDGGSTIAEIGTDSQPFGASNVCGISVVQADVISDTELRVVCGANTLTGTKAQIAYQDIPFGGAFVAASWNVSTIAATSNDDAVTAMLWNRKTERIYIAAATDVYVSTDKGESDPGTAISAPGNAVAAFAMDEDDNVWFVGAGGDIYRELKSDQGTFTARTAPGASAFSSIAFASDGTLFAGYGQYLYKSNNKAADTVGWTNLYDAGASHVVKAIQCRNGTSECLRIVLDDTTPGAGGIRESEDGGNTWRTVTETTNTGYNGAYFPSDYNKAIVVGNSAGGGIAELLSP